ncbi:unnamed protein product [Linum trigynum]|uniref:Bifunctional inhibitor/plant lipid transfer protein/seed storage helical domain-containing protein n=1 Tax=Linum trigynum TaxID=586398 RepID=A0AAV2CZE7_9ROSI
MKATVILILLSCLALLLRNLSISTATIPSLPRPSPTRPLCVSQLALANYACASVITSLTFTDPPMPTATSTTTTIPQPSEILYHLSATEDDGRDVDPITGREGDEEALGVNDDGDEQQKQHHHRHRSSFSSRYEHDHNGGGRRDRHKHRRGRHRNGHRSSHHDHGKRRGDENEDNDNDDDDGGGGSGVEGDQRTASPAEANCCKWVGAVDNECVCELLFRLPTFLARPIHEYTIIVSEWCKITYTCGGRPRP